MAGGALSLAGASAAGWVAAAHLPDLLDVVQQTEAAPAARTVTLAALSAPASVEDPTQPLTAVDPAAVAATATQAGNVPPAAAPRPPAPAAEPSAPAQQPAPPADDGTPPQENGQDNAGPDDAVDRDAPAAETSSDEDPAAESDNQADNENNEARDGDNQPQNDDQAQNDDGQAGDGQGGGDSANPSDSGDADTDGSSGSSGTAGSSAGSSEDGESSSGSATRASGGTGVDARTSSSSLPSAVGRVAGSLPSEIIDTQDWYLTLPTGKEGSPDLVEGSALARYHSQFFQLNQARNGVVFTAGTGGATTSGSQYPRSELREMFGSEKASWDGRKGRHTMEIVEAITETPKEKPDVIAGQIHGTSDDLMQIHLSGQRLRVKYADGQKYVDLDPNYRLGTMFAVKIESSGGRVKVWYNGQQKADLPISSSTSYFKAGVYTNSNPGKGDKSGEGQVVIRSLSVRHE